MSENVVLLMFGLGVCASVGGLAVMSNRVRSRRSAAGWHSIMAINALLFLSLVTLLGMGGEIYFRFFYDSTDSFMYSKVTKRWFERYWVKNANGVRDNVNYTYRRESGKRRVTFLGDSFTGGHGVASVEDRFVNIIRRENPAWEVQALAAPGYDTADHLRLLDELLRNKYELDLVVLVYCLNDISDLLPERHRALNEIQRQVESRPWLVKHSYFLDTMAHRVSVRRNPFMRGYFDVVREAYAGSEWEKQKARLEALARIVERNGGRLVVVTFPFFNALGQEYGYDSAHRTLDAFWKGRQVPHLDLLEVFRGLAPSELTVNAYDAHPNEKAHALAARVIGPFVESHFQAAQKP